MIAVIVNPRSRANRRNPRIAAEFQAIVGDRGRIFAPKTLEELEAMAAEIRRSPTTVIAVHGGDGTLHKTVTALAREARRMRLVRPGERIFIVKGVAQWRRAQARAKAKATIGGDG